MKITIILMTAIFSSTGLASTHESFEIKMINEVHVEEVETKNLAQTKLKNLYQGFRYKTLEEKPKVMIAENQ